MVAGVCPCEASKIPYYKLGVMCLAEFIGTYFLVQSIIFSVYFHHELKALAIGSLAIGSTLMVCTYAWGHVSGAHYNPAVSTAAYVAGKLDRTTWLLYVATQLTAGLLSALLAISLFEFTGTIVTKSTSFPSDSGMYTEFIWTFLLSSVVLNVGGTSMAPGYRNNSFFGLAIGFTVFSGDSAVGGFTGCGFNPAVVTGLSFGKIQIDAYTFVATDWVKALIFQFLGGILAGIVFRITESVEVPADKVETIGPEL